MCSSAATLMKAQTNNVLLRIIRRLNAVVLKLQTSRDVSSQFNQVISLHPKTLPKTCVAVMYLFHN